MVSVVETILICSGDLNALNESNVIAAEVCDKQCIVVMSRMLTYTGQPISTVHQVAYWHQGHAQRSVPHKAGAGISVTG